MRAYGLASHTLARVTLPVICTVTDTSESPDCTSINFNTKAIPEQRTLRYVYSSFRSPNCTQTLLNDPDLADLVAVDLFSKIVHHCCWSQQFDIRLVLLLVVLASA